MCMYMYMYRPRYVYVEARVGKNATFGEALLKFLASGQLTTDSRCVVSDVLCTNYALCAIMIHTQ